ncbi:hypothetical protein BT69DRAFT_1328444 [Atractiella rhizophila]|nr:hypothetical protein BT69DRAFT_1328444 [Atractiella rhizophila]
MTWMIPALAGKDGKALVVVVPFRALLEDPQREMGTLGIRATEWEGSHTSIEPGHHIIFVFSEIVNRAARMVDHAGVRADSRQRGTDGVPSVALTITSDRSIAV